MGGVSRYFTLYIGGVKLSTPSLCRLVAASLRAAGQHAGGYDLGAEQSCVAPQRAQGSIGCAGASTSACLRGDCGALCGRPPLTAAAPRKYAAQRQVAPAFVGGAMDMLVLWLGPRRGPRLLLLVRESDQAKGAPSAAIVAFAADAARRMARMEDTEAAQRQGGCGQAVP